MDARKSVLPDLSARQRNLSLGSWRKPTGDGGKAMAKQTPRHLCDKRHDNLRRFTTIYDILRQFSFLCSIDTKRHKLS